MGFPIATSVDQCAADFRLAIMQGEQESALVYAEWLVENASLHVISQSLGTQRYIGFLEIAWGIVDHIFASRTYAIGLRLRMEIAASEAEFLRLVVSDAEATANTVTDEMEPAAALYAIKQANDASFASAESYSRVRNISDAKSRAQNEAASSAAHTELAMRKARYVIQAFQQRQQDN